MKDVDEENLTLLTTFLVLLISHGIFFAEFYFE